MAIIPTMGSMQGSLIKGEAGLGISVAATILNVVVEEDEAGAGGSKVNGPHPYVPEWIHIFDDTWLENERETMELITNALHLAESHAYNGLSPSAVAHLSTHAVILICM